VLVTNDTNNNSGIGVAGTRGATVTVDTRASKVILPITGGAQAAADSGGFAADTAAPSFPSAPDQAFNTTDLSGATVSYTTPVATDSQDPNPAVSCSPASGTKFAIGSTPVNCTATDANGNASAARTFNVIVRYATQGNGDTTGSVPAQLALALGTPAAFGAFTPGAGKDYTAAATATVVSTAGDAALSIADPSATATGHLVNGAFSLPSALQAQASSPAAGAAGAFAPIAGSSAPVTVAHWTGPVSNDPVTMTFKQSIAATDALRTGTYSTTLTFTLSTTSP
jgi:X-Pro dipeptidyl-peptidase